MIIKSEWSDLRLKDRIRPGLRVLFVGINPGVRSAITGHHFAGYSNRFWKLLNDSRLVPETITYEDDDRLTEWDLGITNLIARPSPGINDLRQKARINPSDTRCTYLFFHIMFPATAQAPNQLLNMMLY